MRIITNEPSKIIINKDTIKTVDSKHYVPVERRKDSLHIYAYTDEKEKTISIDSRNSFAFWLNSYPSTLWAGFLIDLKNPKRYTYPKTIYFDLNSTQSDYLTFLPLDSIISNKKNILKITPWKAIGLMNPGLEISYERKFSKYFTTQLSATYLFPFNMLDLNSGFHPNIKGFQVSIEEKLFFKKSAPKGPYIGMEFSYLLNKYKDIWNFGIKDILSDTLYNYTNYPDTFGINKQTFSANFKFGYQFFSNRISIEIYAGLGIRFKDVRHFDRIKPEDEMEMPRHPNVYYITNLDGKYWTINIPFNFKIGWIF